MYKFRCDIKKIVTVLLFLVLILSAVFSIAFTRESGSFSAYEGDEICAEFLINSENSTAVLDYAMAPFRVQKPQAFNAAAGEEELSFENRYTDEFAGMFIDSDGILNIAMTYSHIRAQGLTRSSMQSFNNSVRYQAFTYSFNHLLEIHSVINSLMQTEYGIFSSGIRENYNIVRITLRNESLVTLVRNTLKDSGLYSTTSLYFDIDPDGESKPQSIDEVDEYERPQSRNAVFGGDDIFESGYRGTVTINATCNVTGRHGIVTAFHVTNGLGNRVHNGTTWMGTSERGQIAVIDSAFVPYEVQGIWGHTPNIRRGPITGVKAGTTTFTNVRTGGENHIVVGQSVSQIGGTTGITNGTITERVGSANVNFGALGGVVYFNNIIRSSYSSAGGDSGGPVVANIGADRFFIGQHFASGGTAARAPEIARILNVTFITNDFSTQAPVQSSAPSFSKHSTGLNHNICGKRPFGTAEQAICKFECFEPNR
ncbi:MAG: S1 family peptidase [Firmicutes bacterium]|nr:S1 family peptidase [Bacillota bacterium]